MTGFVVSFFAASSFDAVALSVEFLEVSSVDSEVPAAGPVHFEGVDAEDQAVRVVQAVENEAVAAKKGLEWAGSVEQPVRTWVGRKAVERLGRAAVCRFLGVARRAATAGLHSARACLVVVPMYVVEFAALQCRPETEPGPVAPVSAVPDVPDVLAPAVPDAPVALAPDAHVVPVLAASRGIAVGAGNSALDHAAFAAEDGPC